MGATRTRRGARRGRPPRWPFRPLPRALARPPVLTASGALALALGLGAGLASGAVPGPRAEPADGAVAPASCAETKDAWARAARAQLRLSADDPATLQRGFRDARDALSAVRPPAAVADDWEVVLGYLSAVTEAVEEEAAGAHGAGQDPEAVTAAVAGAMGDLDTAAMTQASDRVTAFLKEDCGTAGEDA